MNRWNDEQDRSSRTGQRPWKRVGGSYSPRDQIAPHLPRLRRKTKIAPIPAKPCMVLLDGLKLKYNDERKFLFNSSSGDFTTFPSKTRAHRAVWHTIQQLNRDGHVNWDRQFHSDDFEIREVRR